MSKTFFIDTSRCTACRGCQVACKEWQGFPANHTVQIGWGSHQNPPDLNAYNYKVVRFSEHKIRDRVVWNFFPDQCRHCMEPTCKVAADGVKKGAIVVDKITGAVIFTEALKTFTKAQFEDIRTYCPYNVPRRNEQTGAIVKCDMCLERLEAGMVPMCVKTCPTGAMSIGERDQMLAIAKARLGEVRKTFPDASLIDEDSVRVVYLIAYKPDFYQMTTLAKSEKSFDNTVPA